MVRNAYEGGRVVEKAENLRTREICENITNRYPDICLRNYTKEFLELPGAGFMGYVKLASPAVLLIVTIYSNHS